MKNKNKMIAIGLILIFFYLGLTTSSAKIVESDNKSNDIETVGLTGDDLRIKIRGDTISFHIKNHKQQKFEARIRVGISSTSDYPYPPLFQYDQTRVGNNGFPDGYKIKMYVDWDGAGYKGPCEINIEVFGCNKELTARGIATGYNIYAFAGTGFIFNIFLRIFDIPLKLHK